jgi:hypothetical protein
MSSGAYMTLFAIPINVMGKEENVGHRTDTFQIAMAISSIVGAPISGIMFENTFEYKEAGIYAG